MAITQLARPLSRDGGSNNTEKITTVESKPKRKVEQRGKEWKKTKENSSGAEPTAAQSRWQQPIGPSKWNGTTEVERTKAKFLAGGRRIVFSSAAISLPLLMPKSVSHSTTRRGRRACVHLSDILRCTCSFAYKLWIFFLLLLFWRSKSKMSMLCLVKPHRKHVADSFRLELQFLCVARLRLQQWLRAKRAVFGSVCGTMFTGLDERSKRRIRCVRPTDGQTNGAANSCSHKSSRFISFAFIHFVHISPLSRTTAMDHAVDCDINFQFVLLRFCFVRSASMGATSVSTRADSAYVCERARRTTTFYLIFLCPFRRANARCTYACCAAAPLHRTEMKWKMETKTHK